MAFNEQVFYNIVGERIRTARKRRNPRVSQLQLADELRISRASVVNIEAGRQHTPLHMLWLIADALGVDLGSLIPTRDEYAKHGTLAKISEQMAAAIEASAGGDEETYRRLADFVGRAKEQQ
jgi:transcriptional regulator with XRE-family HTH domain